jgi:hypothetical protein
MTERVVELAVAHSWLNLINDDVWEIGAVTPYYWPKRVSAVIDPTDAHPQVTDRRSMFEADFSGRTVLSISTLEHIGTGEYGHSPHGESVSRAFEKLFCESPTFLVTVPLGYNLTMDHYLQNLSFPTDVRTTAIVRSPYSTNDWSEAGSITEAILPYGKAKCTPSGWANGLLFLERGRLL